MQQKIELLESSTFVQIKFKFCLPHAEPGATYRNRTIQDFYSVKPGTLVKLQELNLFGGQQNVYLSYFLKAAY